MYDFPPTPETFVKQLICVLAVIAVAGFLTRPKRKPFFWDAAILIVIALFFTTTMSSGIRSLPGHPRAHSGFVIFTWIITIGAIVLNWCRLAKNNGVDDIWNSFLTLTTIAFLLFCMLPPLTHPQDITGKSLCRNNLKQIGLSLHNYHDKYDLLPLHRGGHPPASWRVTLLPYAGRKALFELYDFEEKWNVDENKKVAKTEVPVYRCVSDPFNHQAEEYPFTSYAALVSRDTTWPSNQSLSLSDIGDGASNTLLVVESCGQRIPWSEPRDVSLNETELSINSPGKELGRSEGALSSFHQGGVQVLLADGAVRFLSSEIDNETLRALTTANGDEQTRVDF